MDLGIMHDEAGGSYLGTSSGQLVGTIDYRLAAGAMIILSTNTEPEFQGRGIAGQITRFALDDARARGLRIVPQCPYTQHFMQTHPEYADLVA